MNDCGFSVSRRNSRVCRTACSYSPLTPRRYTCIRVYSFTFKLRLESFVSEAGFGAKGRQKKRQSTESLVFGVLFVPPIFLFFPTTFAYFASYLVLHAVALLVRAFLVGSLLFILLMMMILMMTMMTSFLMYIIIIIIIIHTHYR